MKKVQKALFLIMCGALCAVVLSCATGGGGGGRSASFSATGEWMVYDDRGSDGGSSTAAMAVDESGVMTITGDVTTQFQYGFAGWGLDPDTETMERLKTASKLTFRILGDGKRYSIKFKTSDIEDYAYFEYGFDTEPGVELFVEVPYGFFFQPSWGTSVGRLRPERVTGVEWQTHESWRPDTFEVKFWDFMIHQ